MGLKGKTLVSAKDGAPVAPSNGWLRYPARAIAALAAAIIVGPFLGVLIAVVANTLVGWWTSQPADAGRAAESVFGLMLPGYGLGAPIAAVAGLIAAWHVAREGRISALRTGVIAFLTPVVPLIVLGGPVGALFGLLYGIPAAGAALLVRYAGMLVWRTFVAVRA